MASTIGQRRAQILQGLRSSQEGSQGRAGVRPQSQIEKLGIGAIRGVTGPLDVVGLAVEPSYGPGGPGVAGTIGELAGSIAPYLLAETALARYVPLLRGRGLLPSATRAATGFGVVEFGRAPQGQETRAGNAVSGALQGAIIGATSGGSILKAGLGGAAATAVPLALGQEVGSPVPITGNETADALIFNSALAMGFQAVGRRMSSDAPPPEASDVGAPGSVPPPPSRPPITDPTRLLRPRTFYQPPAPTDIVNQVVAGWRERRVPARAEVRTAIDEVKMHLDEDPTYQPSPEIAAIPEVASYLQRVNRLRSNVELSAAGAEMIDKVGIPIEPTQLELPGVRERLETFKLAGEFALPRAREVKSTPIEPTKPTGPLVQLVRSADEQASLEAKALELKTSARVTAGRTIALDDVTASSMPEGLAGFDKTSGTIKTAGLGLDDLNRLIDEAKIAGDNSLAQTLTRTQAGLAGRGKKKGVVAPPKERKSAAVASQVVEKAKATELSPEELLLRREDDSLYGETPTLEAHVELTERRIIEVESGDILPGEMTYKSKRFVGDLDRVKQGRSGDTYTYANMLKAMKDMHTPIVGVDGANFKVAMPNETIVTLSKDEIIARIEASLPPTDVAPVYRGADASPAAQPLVRDSREWQQLNLPGVEKVEVRPIPEPSEAVVLKSAEREAVVPATPPPELASVSNMAGKPTTVVLKPTKAKIDKFLEERGLVGTLERLPNRHKTAFVKGEAASKAIEVDVSPQGVVVTDKVSGKRTKVKTLKEAAKIVADSPNNEGPMRSADELRSLFRRRFAAAKNMFERNQIRKKYALYADYMDASPLRPGETPIDSLNSIINRRVPPTVNLDPPSAGGAGRINLPTDPPPTIPGGGPTISDTIPFSEISGMGWRRYFEPMKFWSLELEKKSGGIIPAYTRVFAPLDEARQEMQVFLSGYYPNLVKAWKPFKADTAARERISTYLEAPDKTAAIREHGISPSEVKAANTLRGMWNKLYKELGYEDNLEFIENYVPWRRLNRELSERDALDMFYKNRAKPKSYIVGQELERETNGEWVRERDAFKLFHDYLFRGARKQFVAGPHAEAVKLVNEMSMPSNTESTRKHLVNFVDRMWGTTDASNKALNDFVDGLFQRLGVHHDKQFKTDIVSMMLQLNVGAHMAWRAPLAIRNMFQVFFVYPMVGERAFAYGLKHALTAEGKAEAVKAKIVGPDPVPFGDEIFNPFGTLSQIVRSGLKAYAKVDDYTRVVAYHATKFKVQAAGEKYLAKNWNIAKFIEEAELNSTFHPIEAKQIADMVRSGNIPGAAQRAGYLMQENTNFIYRAGNAPEAFRGVAGRLFGQFGMWPVSYIEYIRYLSTFGTPNQRASKIARFIAVNTAFGHAGTMLGVNTWKWLMFGPLVFTGGPMLQIAQDAGKVASALVQGRLDDDPEASMAEARLKRNLPGSFIPGFGFAKDVEATLEEAKYGARPAITRALLGQSPQAQFSALPPRSRRQEILRRLRSGQQKPPSR